MSGVVVNDVGAGFRKEDEVFGLVAFERDGAAAG